jgi:iron complex transport system substrate-binding protein
VPLSPVLRAAAVGLTLAVLAGCTSTPAANRGSAVTVTSCGRETTYPGAPERAVANDVNMVEMMLALGLADRMAGTAGVGSADEIRPDLRDEYARVPHLAGKYVELEPLLAARADFLLAGWNYGLSEANNLTPDTLAGHGIGVYELTESCAHVLADKEAPTLDEVFTDLTNLGTIFGVPERAEELVDAQRAALAAVDERVAGRTPVPVFVYDSGEDAPFTAPGFAIPTELIRRAGGVNVFAGVPRTWSAVSWEQVVDRDPACVLVVDYDTPTWQQKREFLRDHPALGGVRAVRDDCFLALPYAAMTPGVRNADAVTRIADLLHPVRGDAAAG